MVFVHSGLAL